MARQAGHEQLKTRPKPAKSRSYRPQIPNCGSPQTSTSAPSSMRRPAKTPRPPRREAPRRNGRRAPKALTCPPWQPLRRPFQALCGSQSPKSRAPVCVSRGRSAPSSRTSRMWPMGSESSPKLVEDGSGTVQNPHVPSRNPPFLAGSKLACVSPTPCRPGTYCAPS